MHTKIRVEAAISAVKLMHCAWLIHSALLKSKRLRHWLLIIVLVGLASNTVRSQSYIEWDKSTLRKVSASTPAARYNGYARIIQLNDSSLICVYEADGNVVTVTSTNLGNTWNNYKVVVPRKTGVSMAVPDILLLKDKSILVFYNPSPNNKNQTKRFAIKSIKSYDGGVTWKEDKLLYEAGTKFEDGCWEPAAIQLPNGEIQLYFANEGLYLESNEQNISLLRSHDNGFVFTKTPEIVSFRKGKCDGMPVPLLLNNKKDIVVAIEDNGFGNFKPYIIRNTVAANWKKTVDANSTLRTYALQEKISDEIYAGAPYIRQLSTGETILSYQGTEGRINKMENAEMKVVIGDKEARNFTSKSSSFLIPPHKSGLWNSLAVLHDNTIIAVTSTDAYSENGAREVWMIKGKLKRNIPHK